MMPDARLHLNMEDKLMSSSPASDKAAGGGKPYP
jgi:hypothetical protein